jgi:hypothetical protein
MQGIYVIKFDYNFHLIERQEEEPVKMRIDFTNLEGYWDEVTNGTVTNSTASSRKKRDLEHGVSFSEWKSRIDLAKRKTNNFKRETTARTADMVVRTKDKRWFGPFREWLNKLNTLESEQTGVLPMAFAKFFTLFSGRIFCRSDAGVTFTAGLDVTTDLQLHMDARYSYYFSGTVVPPRVNDMYAFARTQPRVMAGITIAGDAQLGYQTEPRKLISTLTYPGLAIKGIAAVGPSLDIWGQLTGSVTVSGSMRAGVTYTFQPIEMYLPNNDDTLNRAEAALEDNQVDEEGLEPTFEANVQARVDFNIHVSPELNMGIQVGGRVGPFDGTLVDAHISAFANTTLNFNARASAGTVNNRYNWEYDYEIAFLYRIGLAALAQIRFYGEWRSRTYFPVDWQRIRLFGPPQPIRSGVLSPEVRRGLSRRSSWLLSDSPLPGAVFSTPPEPKWPPPDLYAHIDTFRSGITRFTAHGNVTSSSENGTLHTRQEANEHQDDTKSDMEFHIGNQRFVCNQAPAMCGGSGLDQTGDLEVEERSISATTLGPREIGSFGGSPSSRSLALSQRAPSTDDCAVFPRLYYNCQSAFMDWTFVVPQSEGGTGVSNTMEGICKTLDRLMQSYRVVNTQRGSYSRTSALCHGSGCTLTFDADERAQNRRRRQACRGRDRRSKCAADNDNREQILWGPGSSGQRPATGLTSCDEFPFASSEEGGDNYDDDNGDMESIFGTKTVCVPTWQQSLQGNCNGLLRNLETNIRYFNNRQSRREINPDPDSARAEWKSWTDPGWARAGWPDPLDQASNNMQRTAEYKDVLPRPAGFTKAVSLVTHPLLSQAQGMKGQGTKLT